MKKISSFQIDTSDMPAEETTRKFTVSGENGGEFILCVLENDSLKYYDFIDESFELGHNNKDNNLKVTLKGSDYNGNIKFPSGGNTYTIKLIASQGTEIQGKNKNVISTSIGKLSSDATVTFKAATTNTNNYATFSTSTSTGAPSSTDRFDFNWDIVNASTESYGFVLRIADGTIANRITDGFWYFTVTDTVDGAISPTDTNSGLKVIVDDTTDIVAGMIITGVSGGSLSGEPYVLSVDTDTKTLTISAAQTFADGITLTFKAVGSATIKKAIGLEAEFVQHPTVTPEVLTKTIRAGSSGTTINLNGTYGIAGGDHAELSGLGINNSDGATAVTTVDPSSSAGSIVVTNSQSGLITAAVITFTGVSQTINIVGTINITHFPTANRTIYLDIDKFITVGTVS